jgi:peptide/nickel transport system substrate-binding protein
MRLGFGIWVLGFAVGCGSSEPVSDDILRVVIAASPANFDPRIGTDAASRHIHQLVYDELLTIDDQQRVVAGPPALATRLDNPDPLTYIVQLRPGVRFHDGRELTARDVVYTFSSFLDPEVVSPRKAAFRQMASVRALDDYRVEFELTEPSRSFPIQLAMQVVPADSGESLRSFPIGTGPYRFVRYAMDDEVELSAFEGYWDGLPQNAGITLRIVPDDTTRGRELRLGSADLVINETNVAVAVPNIDGVRLTPEASFATLKDVRKRQPYGAALSGPSDRPRDP